MRLKIKIEDDNRKQQAYLDAGFWVSCLNCENWGKDKCIKFDTVPPPKVIVFGCEYWKDTIPF